MEVNCKWAQGTIWDNGKFLKLGSGGDSFTKNHQVVHL